MLLSLCCLLVPALADEESNEDGGAAGSGDEVSSIDNSGGELWNSDNPLAVDISAVSDEATLVFLEEIRDAVYLCCACVMFSGGAVVGLSVVRSFWSV